MIEKETKKIQKVMSELGYCSRREAEKLINNKKVIINEKIANIGDRISNDDIIKVDGKIINQKIQKIYLVFNKPRNTICTLKDPQGRKTIYEYINLKKYAYSIGRLDFNTTGIIIITNDGEFANKMAHPSSQILRTYIAKLEKELTNDELKYLNSQNVILNGKKSIQNVIKLNPLEYKITLSEGRNHHIKNLFLLVNNYVKELHRKTFGILTDKNLKIGEYRHITNEELEKLFLLVEKRDN
ncbi:pseudouridine synthase [Metamycoplasma buccale]|uniref:pseudouridine synthase n=1 Tax=Metamycoplasma buccale TaxID=55602 RepID=UPI00398F24A3